MMVIVPRIAAVSYLNTIPFIYGIGHEGNFRAELLLSPPSLCARNFAEHRADIALVPAAAVPSLADAQVVTEYCIGAAGPVRTVVLLSDEPIETVRRVFLDAHSLTSVQLAGYLFAKHWKTAPEYYTLEDYAQLEHARPGDAFLLIGDKVFDYEGRFAFSYDLAAEWKKATRLPFAFAVWVARKGTDPDLTEGLQHALTFGIEHTYEAVLEHGFDCKPYDAYGYLTQNIDYIFDNQKHKALQKFWDSGIKVSPRANPG
ncbi:menaquinone biosynthetic enzyme MqnA/MqnD family protein [uncultured Alistipes sp.]|uniref:menaquinone biosynthetic enzyme MqnA/MqnD family protein n=1 Tax=uncultured Alistipes sp. TaxID=538949 RepID=UPI0025FEE44F|nr:menaquinone biosynthesis protein [uncultured Alistipes sp.]